MARDRVMSFLVLLLLILLLAFFIQLAYIDVASWSNRARGPLYFLDDLKPLNILTVLAFVATFYNIRKRNVTMCLFILSVLTTARLVIPYFIYEVGFVHHDVPYQYTQYLAYINGFTDPNLFDYHNWPVHIILTGIFECVTGFKLHGSIVIMPLTYLFTTSIVLYVFSKKFFDEPTAIITLMLFNSVAPFNIYYAPQNMATLLTILASLLMVSIAIKPEGLGQLKSLIVFFLLEIMNIFTHAMLPLAVLIVPLVIIVIPILFRMLSLRPNYESLNKTGRPLFMVFLTTVLIIIAYNTYLATFVFKEVHRFLEALITEGIIQRLDVINATVTDPSIISQLNVILWSQYITWLSLATLALISIFNSMRGKGGKNSTQIVILTLGVTTTLLLGLWLTLGVIFDVGLVERYQAIAIYIGLPLSAYSLSAVINQRRPHKKIIYTVVSALIVMLGMLSTTSTHSYNTLYLYGMNTEEIHMASYICKYIQRNDVAYILTGYQFHSILTRLICYKDGVSISALHYSREFDYKVCARRFDYQPNTIIFTTPLTKLKPSVIRLTDAEIMSYVEALPARFSIIYSDSFDVVYFT